MTATCLTSPAPGGIAVVQVIAWGASHPLHSLFQSRSPIDLATLAEGELRFCRVVDGQEVLDDAIVAARTTSDGASIVEINLHGGPRIVQRVLLALKRLGAAIVDPAEHAGACWPHADSLDREMLAWLPRAKTRAVAVWLARAPGLLRNELRAIVRQIESNELERAREGIASLVAGYEKSQHLLKGIRIVLIGEPNSGKSTLANALAGEERSIVSDVAGTTRDWVELPAAIQGAPVTWVDTAGLRQTDDPIEQESIRRTRDQLATADVILRVIDGSVAPSAAIRESTTVVAKGGHSHPPQLFLWNKCDLPRHPDHAALLDQAAGASISLSARSGAGHALLRERILEMLKMTDWPKSPPLLFTPGQATCCRNALSALMGTHPLREQAGECITMLMQIEGQSPRDPLGMI